MCLCYHDCNYYHYHYYYYHYYYYQCCWSCYCHYQNYHHHHINCAGHLPLMPWRQDPLLVFLVVCLFRRTCKFATRNRIYSQLEVVSPVQLKPGWNSTVRLCHDFKYVYCWPKRNNSCFGHMLGMFLFGTYLYFLCPLKWQGFRLTLNVIFWFRSITQHYDDVIMSEIASQITSLTIVYSAVHSGADQSKHQSSASLAFVWEIHRWPVNFPHKWPVTRKIFPFDDVIMRLWHSD